MNKIGTIDISRLKTPPEKSEFETAKYLAERYFDGWIRMGDQMS